ncbi:O-antigen ligase family protein [Aeromicrobium sp. CTD01-1L150]|uniref:O-antigen ligase family protein n=1 Tax=Aeromicrobium sp. CTD01-1L150 TaxID=3341830 RepID=UPI0035BF2FA1
MAAPRRASPVGGLRTLGRATSRGLVALVPAALVAGVLYVWLPLASESDFAALAGLALVAALALVLSLGLERFGILMLSLALFAAPMNAVRPIPGVGFATASDLLLLLGIGALAPLLLTRPVRGQTLYLIGAGGVVAMSLLSSAVASGTLVSLNIIARLVVGALLLPLVFAMWRPGRSMVVTLASAYVLGNIANLAHAVFLGDASPEGRLLGLSMHVNILGFCAMLALALIPYLLRELPHRLRGVVVVAGGLCAYGVWVSGSRAALVVAVAIGLLYPVVARSIPALIALFGGGVVAIWFVGNALLEGESETNTLGRLFGAGSATASDQARDIEAAGAMDAFLSSPIVGGGFTEEILDAHNIYLQVAAAGGLLVLAFYLVLLAAVGYQSLRCGKRHQLLVLPVAAYILIGPLTPLLWDRYIWCVLALPFLLDVVRPDDDASHERGTADPSREDPVTP